jgi:radical SAM superfamily enzyme YgiQ (UPF0313 family)
LQSGQQLNLTRIGTPAPGIPAGMRVHLINPSDMSFGTAVITPRWLYVLAAATPKAFGDAVICDETLEQLDPASIHAGDIVGIGIHTGNALRGYEVGKLVRSLGATVIYGGIHASLYPEESLELGGAHAVVKGDGDVIWTEALHDCVRGSLRKIYDGGRIEPEQFVAARWDLMKDGSYMWASVQTVRGCAKHCSFCSVWRTDGQRPRQRASDGVIQEIVELRRKGFRFIALADDNFYPVTKTDLRLARQQGNSERVAQLEAMRDERFVLMARLAELPRDMVFFTQITMEAAEDTEFLDAMKKARIKGALVGVEAVTAEGLKAVFKDFNYSGDGLVKQLQTFRKHDVHVLGSFIFGLPTDKPDTFHATAALAKEADITFAQFVMMTPFPGTVDFQKWEKLQAEDPQMVDGIPLTRYWLIPARNRPKMMTPHGSMSSDEIRERTQGVWDSFYSMGSIWRRSRCVQSLRGRLAFVLISRLYRQMYAKTGISTDSARKGNWVARTIAKPCRLLFQAKPMPELQVPVSAPRVLALAKV